MKTQFTFRSTNFNCSEPRSYFINECCYGDDVCRWLIFALSVRGYEVDSEPYQEDFGWYFQFMGQGIRYNLIIGFQDNDASNGDCWIGWLERPAAIWCSVLRHNRRPIASEIVADLNEIMTCAREIEGFQWDD